MKIPTLPVLAAACAALSFSAWPTASPQVRRVDESTLKTAGESGDDWLSYGLTQAETRYSPLAQITAGNVTRLGLAWSYDLGPGGGNQETTPLVWNGTLYGITNWSVVFAVDVRTGSEKWRWDPEVNQAAVRPKICCGVVNRGLAIYQGLIIAPVIDGRLQAHDAETGRVVWETRVAFPQEQQTITMAPRIAKNKVIIGVSGGDKPTRGFFDAYDAMTGHRAWRFYTVPGDPSKPFENAAMKKAAETWDGTWWKNGGGGAVWDGLAYDPEAELVYVGTGNAEPWPQQLRTASGKDNLYVCSILAVHVDSGELKWHYQVVPGDIWDYDSVQHLMLATLVINGRSRKVIMQANKDGFFYVLDRLTGQFVSAAPYASVNWSKGVDPRTGRPMVNPGAYYSTESVIISPGAGGAHNWSPMSFNPRTGLVYIPTTSFSQSTHAAEPVYDPSSGRTSGTVRGAPPPKTPPLPMIGPEPVQATGGRGALVAWDPAMQLMRWRQPGGGGIGGGTLSTAGNLVFQAINDGRLVAYSADRGEKLLEVQTGLRSGMGAPITYRFEGRQYVSVMGGVGTVIAAPGRGNAPATAPAAATPPAAPKLLTFVLDGTTPLPAAQP
jgi:quinohemoprotein ethanol dehydrogenase